MKRILNYISCALCLLAFAACEDVPAPYDINNNGSAIEIIEPAGSGTAADPYNVVKALNLINAGENDPNTDVYVKGIISQNDGSDNIAQYGNMTYYISDNGKTQKQLEVYRGYGLDGKKFTSIDDIAVGDTVIVKGKLVMYSSTPEFTQGSSIVYQSGKGGSITPPAVITGDNLLANGDFEAWDGNMPTNWQSASTASNAALSQSTEAHGGSYAVKIGFSETQNKRLAYKELTLKAGTYEWSFYAKATTTASSQCQGGYVAVNNGSVGDYTYLGYTGLNSNSWTLVSGTFTLEAQTTVCLVVMNPKTSSYATAQEILVDDASLKTNDGGIAEGGDTPDTPSPSEAKGDGTLANPYNPTAANAYISTLPADTNSDKDIYVKGKISSIKEAPNAQYGNATFYISEDGKSTSEQFYAFRVYNLGNKKFTGSETLNVGDEVIICGKVVNYKGNTPETASNLAYIYSINNEGGNNTPDTPDTPTPGDGNAIDVAAAMALLAAMEPAAQSSEEYTVSGEVESVTEISAQYGNATFVLKGGLTIFRTKSFGGANFTDENAIKAGDNVKVKGYLKKYVKDDVITPELVNGTLVELNGKTEGDTTDTPDNDNEKVITFTAGVDRGSLTSDSPGADKVTKNGVTISITNGCLGNNDNYRTYKGQSMTVSATSNIASIVFTCTAADDAKYGPGCWTATPGTYTYEDKVGTWTGDASSVTFNAAANQVRATKIVVTLK